MADICQKFRDELLDDLEHDRLVLPTLPEVALRVRDVADDENASLNDLTKIIASDPALSARLIQVANSPLMRISRKIESVDAAVQRLGMRMVRDLATSMVMEQMFQATSDVTDRRLRQLWAHSTEVAAIAHALASQFTNLNPEQALLAGLVHEIGALPILTKAEDVPEVLQNEEELDTIIHQLHTRIGAAILQSWNFPAELVAVAAEHEDVYRNSPQTDYADVVIVANLQSKMVGDHPPTDIDFDRVPAFAKLGLSAEVNVIEMEGTGDTIRETQALLNI